MHIYSRCDTRATEPVYVFASHPIHVAAYGPHPAQSPVQALLFPGSTLAHSRLRILYNNCPHPTTYIARFIVFTPDFLHSIYPRASYLLVDEKGQRLKQTASHA